MTTPYRYKVFLTEPRQGQEPVLSALKKAGCSVLLGRPFTDAAHAYSERELCQLVAGVDALMVGSRERFTRQVMEAAPRLKTIAKLGIGTERIDIQAATDLGILVSHTPIPENYLAVAEGTVARILALAKNLKLADRNARLGLWRSVTNTYLRGKTVGIVGLGRIGSRVAELLGPFEVRLLAYDPYVSMERGPGRGIQRVELESLLRESDFVTLHAVVTPETRGLIGEAQIRLMKPTAYLVNTARGALVEEGALAQALREGWIAGAALDVFEPEPPSSENPLLAEGLSGKTLFSPHTAGATPELAQKMPWVQLENCLKALRGEAPEYVVNPQVLSRWRRTVTGKNEELTVCP